MASEGSRMRQVLERVAQELRDEEAREELEELRQQVQPITVAQIRQLIAEAPPEERAALREALQEGLEDVADDEPPKSKRKKDDDDDDSAGDDQQSPPAPNRRTRPGRKSQQAYDWTIDEETGEIVRAPMAYIYTGEDEPDEVELMPVSTRDAEEDDDAQEE